MLKAPDTIKSYNTSVTFSLPSCPSEWPVETGAIHPLHKYLAHIGTVKVLIGRRSWVEPQNQRVFWPQNHLQKLPKATSNLNFQFYKSSLWPFRGQQNGLMAWCNPEQGSSNFPVSHSDQPCHNPPQKTGGSYIDLLKNEIMPFMTIQKTALRRGRRQMQGSLSPVSFYRGKIMIIINLDLIAEDWCLLQCEPHCFCMTVMEIPAVFHSCLEKEKE